MLIPILRMENRLKQLIIDSFQELRDRPSLFLPKIFTSLIGSIWMLAVLRGTETMNTELMIGGLLVFPAVFFLGVWSPVLVAEMVKEKSGLKEALRSSTDYLGRMIGAAIILIAGTTISLIPFYTGVATLIIYGTILPAVIGGLLSAIMVLIIVYGIYFLPITLIDNNLGRSFRESFNTSRNNSKEVTALLIFSFMLLGLAASTTGRIRNIGIAGFITGRAISSIISTYTVIISPKYYLEEVEKEK